MASSIEEEEKRDIPMDLYEEILHRLPSKDLLRCKCVGKDWLRLISSPEFLEKHLRRYENKVTRILILMPDNNMIDYNHDYGNEIYKEIPYPDVFGGDNTTIMGSCDGLICYFDKDSRRLTVFNPSTRASDIRRVDGIYNSSSVSYWFGHYPSGEYALAVASLFLDKPRLSIEVYGFSSNLKSVQSCSVDYPVLFLIDGVAIDLHGNLHWVAIFEKDGHFVDGILTYSFERNRVAEISPPERDRWSYFRIGVVEGCLSTIIRRSEKFELWVMREYGVEESWTNYGNFEGHINGVKVLYPLGFSCGGDLVVDAGRARLYKYNFNEKKAKLVMDKNSRAILCDDSFVSPAFVWGENCTFLLEEQQYDRQKGQNDSRRRTTSCGFFYISMALALFSLGLAFFWVGK